jgi:hypothetical protein
MESIEEQWNPEPAIDIISNSWLDIVDVKKAVKIWILDHGESWAPANESNKIRLQLHCLLSISSFYIRVARQNNGLFGVTSYISSYYSVNSGSGESGSEYSRTSISIKEATTYCKSSCLS